MKPYLRVKEFEVVITLTEAEVKEILNGNVSNLQNTLRPLIKSEDKEVRVQFNYTDARGEETVRTIKVLSIFKKNGKTMVNAIDLDKNAPRCFVFDKMKINYVDGRYTTTLSSEIAFLRYVLRKNPKLVSEDF